MENKNDWVTNYSQWKPDDSAWIADNRAWIANYRTWIADNQKWEDTRNRYVAFMDIMGFREMVFRSDYEAVLKSMLSLNKIIDVIKEGAEKKVKPVIFSDSILLISKDDSENSARYIMLVVSLIIDYALSIVIPIKGAIAWGKQTSIFEKSIHFGKPLIDAYELQNEVMLYGVVLHHTMEKKLLDDKLIDQLSDTILKYQIPMRTNKINHYILKPFNSDKDKKSVIERLYGSVSGSARCYVDNTDAFFKDIKKYKV